MLSEYNKKSFMISENYPNENNYTSFKDYQKEFLNRITEEFKKFLAKLPDNTKKVIYFYNIASLKKPNKVLIKLDITTNIEIDLHGDEIFFYIKDFMISEHTNFNSDEESLRAI